MKEKTTKKAVATKTKTATAKKKVSKATPKEVVDETVEEAPVEEAPKPTVHEIAAELPKAEAAAKRTDAFTVSVDNLIVDVDYNVRETDTAEAKHHLAWMVQSIQKSGITVPLRGYKVSGNRFVLTQGHTRYAAAKILESRGVKVEIPFIEVEKSADGSFQSIFDLVVSNSGKPLSVIEKAKVVERLMSLGLKKKEIADGFGETQANIDHLCTVTKATEQTKDWIRNGDVSASAAIDIVRELGPEAAEKELGKLVAKAKAKSEATPATGKAAKKKAVSKADVKGRKGDNMKMPIKAMEDFKDELQAENEANPKKKVYDDNAIWWLQLFIDWSKGELTDDEFKAAFKK